MIRNEKVNHVSADKREGARRMRADNAEERQEPQAAPGNDNLANEWMERISSRSNLNQAYKRVKANKGAAGIDGLSVKELKAYIGEHKEAIVQSLLDGSYQPQPIRPVEIAKPDGGVRQLGIPTVMDRLIQQAILQILQPVFDPSFSESSFGFRPGRSAHQAVKRAQKYVQAGQKIVVDIDLEKFFDRVNHDILMARLAKRIEDKRLLKIIRRFLKAGILQDGVGVVREQGVMQGGPLSPLLSNILLDELDKELERRGHSFCRYADDCNIYVKSLKAGVRVLSSITDWLEAHLKLQVNEAKSGVAAVDLRQFLGYRLRSTGELDLPKKSEARLRAVIRQVTKRNRGVSFAQVIRELNGKLRGWSQYFKWLEKPKQLATLDSWIRRKLRCYRLKQWKNSQTIKANLIRLGVKPRSARETSSSGKGWWRLSRTPALHKGLSNRWFEEQGLLNLQNQVTRLQGIT